MLHRVVDSVNELAGVPQCRRDLVKFYFHLKAIPKNLRIANSSGEARICIFDPLMRQITDTYV